MDSQTIIDDVQKSFQCIIDGKRVEVTFSRQELSWTTAVATAAADDQATKKKKKRSKYHDLLVTVPLEKVIGIHACHFDQPSKRLDKKRLTCPCTPLAAHHDLTASEASMAAAATSVLTSTGNGASSGASSSGYTSGRSSECAGSDHGSASGPLTESRESTPVYGHQNHNALTISGSDPNVSQSSPSPPLTAIGALRLHYAKPSGKYRYKLAVTTMTMPIRGADNDDKDLNSDGGEGLRDLIHLIQDRLAALRRPRRILAFVNPYGGKRMAVRTFHKRVLPLFRLAGIVTDFVITQRAQHARDLLLDLTFDLDRYSGVICVGGDGMFAELLNGLIVRVNSAAGVEVNQERNNGEPLDSMGSLTASELIVPTMPLGVIPAGSTDAVAFNTTGDNDPVTSAMHVIIGSRVALDICALHSVDRGGELIRYATSFLGYGYFGDLLAESEYFRWMGPTRYDVAASMKFLRHSLYEGQVKMLVSADEPRPTRGGGRHDEDTCRAGCETCARALANRSTAGDNLACVTVKGRFVGINAATMACRCEKTKKGISSTQHLGNGTTDLILVSDCSRFKYLQYLLRTGFSSMSPFNLDFVDAYRVREFQFTPCSTSPPSPGTDGSVPPPPPLTSVWNCDGEIISEPSIHVKVHCQLVSVFGSGPEVREKRSSHKNKKSTKVSHETQNNITTTPSSPPAPKVPIRPAAQVRLNPQGRPTSKADRTEKGSKMGKARNGNLPIASIQA